jgi:hypothetical protein
VKLKLSVSNFQMFSLKEGFKFQFRTLDLEGEVTVNLSHSCDSKTDSFTWIGPKLGKRMSQSRASFMGSAHETEKIVRLGLPRIIQRKENAPEFDYSSFYAKIGAGDPLLCGGGLAFLMTCPRTAAHEETELLTVLKIPFRVRTC